jgi:anti-sigma regulatory factor (Ser/Thr protein kinase)
MTRQRPIGERPDPGPELEYALPPGPAAVPAARRALGAVAQLVEPERFADLRLLVSELVTNSLRHAGLADPGTRLSLRVDPGVIRVEVADRGSGFVPRVHPPHPGQRWGWGLLLVDRLADRWGADPGDPSSVWFEMPTVDPQRLAG